LTRFSDSLLVQDHIDKLQKTQRPAPSLHHLLAKRLESCRQDMNMPTTTPLTQSDFDPSWTLFDQNNIELAAGTCYQQEAADSSSTLAESAPSLQARDPLLQHRDHQGYSDGELWDAYGNPGSSWPSGFNRIFGNPFFLDANDGNQL
jgi:hypothetical protein